MDGGISSTEDDSTVCAPELVLDLWLLNTVFESCSTVRKVGSVFSFSLATSNGLRRTSQGYATPRTEHAPLTEPPQSEHQPLSEKEND
jgi:hypothetical protein